MLSEFVDYILFLFYICTDQSTFLYLFLKHIYIYRYSVDFFWNNLFVKRRTRTNYDACLMKRYDLQRILTRKLEREGVASHVREMKALLASSQFVPTYS